MGAEIRAIGNGTALMAQDFVEQFAVPFPVYTDPSRLAFEHAELKRGFSLSFKTLSAGVRAFKAGHRQVGILGDALQQGGLLVVARGGALLYRHADEAAGDHAPPSCALEALKSRPTSLS